MEFFHQPIDCAVHGEEPSTAEMDASKPRTLIMGVEVTCRGDRDLGAAPFVQFNVPHNHPLRNPSLFKGNVELSEISAKLGIPVRGWRSTESYMEYHDTSNTTACKLFMDMTFAAHTINHPFGEVPQQWQNNSGNVMLVRADDQDLTVDEAELLCQFVEDKLEGMMWAAVDYQEFVLEDSEKPLETRIELARKEFQKAVDFISRENMEAFKLK
jgi:hypothetical protein